MTNKIINLRIRIIRIEVSENIFNIPSTIENYLLATTYFLSNKRLQFDTTNKTK